MNKISTLMTLLALLMPAVSQAALPADAHQWEVHNANGLSYGTDYELYNQQNQSQIGYENKELGSDVDLGWVGHSGGHFNFMRKAAEGTRDHRTGPIPENADVAIYNTKVKRWLKYKKFDETQAELEWSTKPAYEWQVQDQKGTSVASFALFNSRAKKYLVLQSKVNGINLGWFKGTPPLPQTKTFDLTLARQTVTEGYYAYSGKFPVVSSLDGNLKQITNLDIPLQHLQIAFVRIGHGTQECGDPAAIVMLDPGKSTTPETMKNIYETSSPPLAPVNFLACVGNPAPPLLYIRIEYTAQ